MRMRKNLGVLFAACALFLMAVTLAGPAKAGGVSADTLALFPKDTGEIGYVDLKKARDREMVPRPAGTNPAGAVQAIREVSRVGWSGSQQPSR